MGSTDTASARIVLAPAERADVLVDLSSAVGRDDRGQQPSSTAQPVTTPAPPLAPVMQIRVAPSRGVRHLRHPRKLSRRSAARSTCAVPSHHRRSITLNEVRVDTDGWELTLNGVGFDDAPPTERPRVGTVEDWYYINLTGDTHPMHVAPIHVPGGREGALRRRPLHRGGRPAARTAFQVAPTPGPSRPDRCIPADPTERGYKDTVKANPGTFTTIRARFDLPARRHCAADLRPPLPHPRTRGQRHDAALHRLFRSRKRRSEGTAAQIVVGSDRAAACRRPGVVWRPSCSTDTTGSRSESAPLGRTSLPQSPWVNIPSHISGAG